MRLPSRTRIIFADHPVQTLLPLEIALDQPDGTLTLAAGLDRLQGMVEAQEVVLAFLVEYLLHPRVVHFVRELLHNDADHRLPRLVPDVDDVVEVDDLLLLELGLGKEEHADVDEDLREAGL